MVVQIYKRVIPHRRADTITPVQLNLFACSSCLYLGSLRDDWLADSVKHLLEGKRKSRLLTD